MTRELGHRCIGAIYTRSNDVPLQSAAVLRRRGITRTATRTRFDNVQAKLSFSLHGVGVVFY